MTDAAIKYRLYELPNVPPVFARLLKVGDRTELAHYPLSNSKTPSQRSNSSAPAKRHPISAARFAEIAALRGSFCFWCGIKVIRIAQIPQRNRLEKNDLSIVYLSDSGEVCEEAFGTIDHLVRVADGGRNNLGNLVISCYPCNQMRDQQANA